ncbi:MAG TPA: hypothetical protein VIY48_05195 [Candidatus Paceibacterota bacterium]
MAAISGPTYLAPTGTTGNNTHAGVNVNPSDRIGIAFVIEAVGATPTVTFAINGSQDGVNWVTAAIVAAATPGTVATTSGALTTVGQFHFFLPDPTFYKYLRVVSSANTNVTYRVEQYSLNH